MSRGQVERGRRRAQLRQAQRLGATPLLTGEDHGDPVIVDAGAVGEDGRSGAWAESFIQANREGLERLALRPQVLAEVDEVRLALHPSGRLGAIPLRTPSTRKVAAGLVVRPRFGWDAVGAVLADVGFGVEPSVGGGPLVPGSAREVPPWILAGPVMRRIARLLAHLTRAFSWVTHDSGRIRGTVDWNHYARHALPSGRWDAFRCTHPELQADAWLLATLRWTIGRVRADLERIPDSAVARVLIREADELLLALGAGPSARPGPDELSARTSGLGEVDLRAGLEAMGWVSEERGLGGARTLDGLPWSLQADALWEGFVESFVRVLAQRVGARALGRGQTRRPLQWTGHPASMRSLAPDLGLVRGDLTVWIDAKYKHHLTQLNNHGWDGASDTLRESHRADLHQALAYASLSATPRTVTLLAYPSPSGRLSLSVAEVGAGRSQVQLALAGLPFGFVHASEREESLAEWERLVLGRP